MLGRRLALHELREPAVAEELQRLHVDVELRDLLAVVVVLAQRPAVAAQSVGFTDERVEDAPRIIGVVDPQHRPLVRERALGERPALVELAQQVLLRHNGVGEEDLVEVGVVVMRQLRERAALDARGLHIDDEDADAFVLRRVGVGAHEAHAPVGVVRARRPHLLAVDDEVVAVEHGSGLQARQVAARARLAHAQAPRDLGPQRRQQPALLLLRCAVVVQRRRDDAETGRVEGARDPPPPHLLEIDHLLDRRRVAPAQLRRPARHQKAVVEQLPLPLA